MAAENISEKTLEVKDLRVSFKTNNGSVKAVRGISFSLYKGKTLAIVGESGSGKSVTSRSILGILQNNKIIEGGQILYDGMDLLRLDEDEFTKIRGSRISMIFQDPLSALNPIVRVGKQLTEAMILKNKSTIHFAKVNLKQRYNVIKAYLKKDPSISEADKEAFKHLSEATDFNLLSESDVKLLEEKFEKVVADNIALVQDKRKIALEYVLKGKQEYLKPQDKENFNVRAFKKYSHGLKKIMKESLNLLAERKDDESATFASTVLYEISEYHAASKLLVKNTKYQARMDKRAESGKKAKSNVKRRAFSSERILTPDTVFDSLSELFDNQIAHIEASLAITNRNVTKRAEGLVKYICKANYEKVTKVSKEEAYEKAIGLMKEVDIPEPERRFKQYPFEFSGGMRQRVVIAIALSSNPEILICDEPTTALDVTVQAQILETITRLKKERGLSIIFITHNLGVVANVADDIAVMYAGKIVEYGTADDIFYDPKHPYTWALLSSMPDLFTKEKLEAIPGTPPNMIIPPKGDAFAVRNKYAMKVDFEKEPPLFRVSNTHSAATWLLDPLFYIRISLSL